MKKLFMIVISLSLIFVSNFIVFGNSITSFADSNANKESEIVMESTTKRVLYGKDIHQKMFMASTTKILTAITIIENCNLGDIVTVGKESVGVEGSSIYLEVGEKLTVKQLLYGLMLRSGNDCAETLALYCSNSIKDFAELMNKTANKIGAKESNFTNPHGLHDDNHYTTAYDLALISSYAMQNKDFKEIVSTKSVKIPQTTRDYDRILINKNKILKEFDGATGIKTGYTKKAGRCLVSSATKNGVELICVVLNCQPMFERSKSLLTQNFSNCSMKKIVESDNIIDFIETFDGKKCGIYIKKDIIIPILSGEESEIKTVYDIPKVLSSPLKKDSCIGKVKIYIKNNLIFEENIYTIIDI